MQQSTVYVNIPFLSQLREATVPNRKVLIERATRQQIDAISDIVDVILEGHVIVVAHDIREFRRFKTLLRQIANPRISTARKKTSLSTHHALIPRLIRTYYVIGAIVYRVTSAEP
jgi:hypothetical protein